MPPRQPPGSRLTRERIIAAATNAAERGELAELSMRGLAGQLGVAPMALYRYVRSKDELLDEVVDRLLRNAGLPDCDPADWREWMRQLACSFRDLLVRHPVALRVFASHPVATPAALERLEAGLAVLRAAGLDGRAAVEGYASLHTYCLGFAALEVARARASEDQTRPASTRRYWQVYFATLSSEEFPNLAELAPNLSDFTSERQFEVGLERLLEGMALHLPKRAATRRSRARG